VRREEAYSYLGKADEFLESANRALAAGLWDAAGLGAVHAAISAADAVMVFRGGIRSAEQDHRVARDLLEEIVGPEAKPVLRHLSAVLAKKNLVEYEQRRLKEKEAIEMVAHARRFLSWAGDMMPRRSE
jgi:HEPN domain-containing protein